MDSRSIVLLTYFLVISAVFSVFVDKGVPYTDGPLKVGELTVTVTVDKSPKHVKVYFPLGVGEFSVVYFIGGLYSIIPAESYSVFLTKLASHGFFVFGVDYVYPLSDTIHGPRQLNFGQDINTYFLEMDFLRKYMQNRTVGVPRWDDVGLLCHSAGCDITLKMIEINKVPIKASIFLEPYSQQIREPVNYTVPALMYGTQLASEGIPCSIKGFDYEQFYKQWKCPRIVLEAADFGHCDILDPVAWESCHYGHFCKTTNNTRLDHYRQFVQGVAASFFITTLQGRPDAVNFVTDQSKLTSKCLVDTSDLNCSTSA